MVGKLSVVIKFVKLISDSEILLIMKLMLTLSMKDLMQKMLFSMVFFKINTPQVNLVNRSQYGNVVILTMK